MGRTELRAAGEELLGQARALRAAFPDVAAMGALPVATLPAGLPAADPAAGLRAALGYLRDEMLLVRSGGADDLVVLDDEIAHAEGLFRGLTRADTRR
jgi:hypothetical protein